jgi:hypothetical protein
VLRQLNRKLGAIAIEFQTAVQQLSVEQLQELGEALLDFSDISDLVNWLQLQTTTKE